MLLRFKGLIGLSLVLVFSACGCALTVNKVPLNYETPTDFTISVDVSDKNIILKDLEDLRSIPDKTYLVQKRNGYGQIASGALQAEKEVAVIITDAIKDVLISNDYKLVEDGADYIIKGKLMNIEDDYIMGMWAGQLKLKIEVELSLVNVKNNDTVWKEFFIGTGISDKSMTTGKAVPSAFAKAMDDFLAQFVKSDLLKKLDK